MYWDCIFLARLYESDISSGHSRRGAGFDPFGGLSNALGEARKVLARIKEANEEFQAPLKQLDDVVKPDFCHNNPSNEICKVIPTASQPCVSIEQCGKDVFCRENPSNEICKILPRPTPLCPCRGLPFCPC